MRITTPFLWALLCVVLATPLQILQATNYYVSPYGNDFADGSLSEPLKTIQAAANKALPGDRIILRQGVYRELVRPVNSGTSSNPIIFESYNGETATLSGGEAITEWDLHSGSIYKSSSPIMGMVDPTENQIFIDGQSGIEARWPNSDGDISRPHFAHFEEKWWESGSPYFTINGVPYFGYTMKDDHLLELRNTDLTDVRIYIRAGVNWYSVEGTVGNASNIGSSNGQNYLEITVQVADYNKSQFGPQAHDPYYLVGALGLIDSPNEYYIDSQGYVYLMLPGGSSPENHLIEYKAREFVFDLTERDYITIRNLHMYGATITTENEASPFDYLGNSSDLRSAGILIDNIEAQYISHKTDIYQPSPTFRFNNNTGIMLNGEDHEIRNSVIYGSSGNGITLVGKNNSAINNIVVATGYIGTDTAGISTGAPNGESDGTIIRSNTVVDSGRANVLLRAITNGEVTYNRVAHSTLQTEDYGGIYAWGHSGQNTIIAYNEVSDSYAAGAGASAIYMDDGSTDFIIHHNITWNTKTGLLLNLQAQGSGAYTDSNQVWNNTLDAHVESLGSVNGMSPPSGWWSTTIRNNIFTSAHLYRSATQSTNIESTIDPLFNNTESLNYGLRSGSPALNMGWHNSTYHAGLTVGQVDAGARERSQPMWTSGAGSNGEQNLTSPHAPDGPTNLTLSFDGTSTITLSWDDNSNHESAYIIERTTRDQLKEQYNVEVEWYQIAHLPPNTTQYDLTNQIPNTDYYRVRAPGSPSSNEANIASIRAATNSYYTAQGDASNGVNGMGPQSTLATDIETGDWVRFDDIFFPSIVSTFNLNVQGWSSNTGGSVEIRQNSLTGPIIASANIPANINGNYTANDNTVSLSQAQIGTHDIYIIFTGQQSIANISDWTFTTSANTAPDAPASLTVNTSSTTANINWNSSTGADSYVLERSENGGFFVEVANTSNTNFNDSALLPHTGYTYRVKGRNTTGDSNYTYYTTATANPTGMNPPTNLQSSNPSGKTVSVNWNDNANAETGYEIQVSPNGLDTWETVKTVGNNSTSTSFNSPAEGAILYIRIRAYNATTTSQWSSMSSVSVSGGYVPTASVYEGFVGSINSSTLGWGAEVWTSIQNNQGNDQGHIEHSIEILTFGDLPVSGQSAMGAGQTTTNNGWGIVKRDLETPYNIQNSTTYISWLFHPNSMTWNAWNQASLKVNSELAGSSIELTLGMGGNNTGDESWSYSASGTGSISLSDDTITMNITYLHLAELAESGGNVRLRIWRYDDPLNLPTTMPTTSDTHYLGEITGIAAGDSRIHNIGYSTYGSRAQFDEIRIGDTFESVMGEAQKGSSPTTPFEDWQQATFIGSGLSLTDAAADNDYDGDGLVNLIEYAVGTDPLTEEINMPAVEVRINGDYLMLEYSLDNLASDISVYVEQDSTPEFTSPTVLDTKSGDGSLSFDLIQISSTQSLSSGPLFMRLRVELQ